MLLYTAVGSLFGVVQWVLLWGSSTVVINVWCPPRHYFWCKTLCMAAGVGSQLAQAWQLVTPIDRVGRQWILFMAIAYPPPLIFEDIRDMAGDEVAGRRTLALLLGDLPIRVWFAAIMTVMPWLAHVLLSLPTAAERWRILLCSSLVTMVCWTTVIRSLALRTVNADRITYQLFIFSYIVVLCSGCVLWA